MPLVGDPSEAGAGAGTGQEEQIVAFMVTFKTGDGKPGYHQAEDLDTSLRFVEHLRNSEGVENARVYRLDEVPIEVKTYYKVEVARPSGADGAAPDADLPPSTESEAAVDAAQVTAGLAAPESAGGYGDPVGAGARRGRFR